MTMRHVFLVSHMRANTSLIGHILGSHPHINGYYELHLGYKSVSDLSRQAEMYSAKEPLKPEGKYLFDKLLHNDYDLLLEEFDPGLIKTIVSIRPAEQSIKSILCLFAAKKEVHPYAKPIAAVNYYIERLLEMARFCELYPGQYYYYDANIIRDNPRGLLPKIQQWLGLKTAFSEEYQLFSQTGQARVGDSSDNMHAGKIIKAQTNYDKIVIDPHLLQQAISVECDARKVMLEHARDAVT
ncbi:MAG: hypothetical protein HOM11_09625 [Methylococcales bacterium]|nr:hypothetical protein [Methylococcales bacterium]MBT7445010.1 hypothetical protein [Methylococcales bacterium]